MRDDFASAAFCLGPAEVKVAKPFRVRSSKVTRLVGWLEARSCAAWRRDGTTM